LIDRVIDSFIDWSTYWY